MPINQANKDKPVHCIACGKIIARGYIADGALQIQCKCGVKNRLEAEHKPEGRKYFIDHEPAFDAKGRMTEISMVLKRTE